MTYKRLTANERCAKCGKYGYFKADICKSCWPKCKYKDCPRTTLRGTGYCSLCEILVRRERMK